MFTAHVAEGPVIACAIHAGHALRSELAANTALDDAARLREEDPYTDLLAEAADSRVVFHRSRFEIDLNRPREQAVYARPQDAWGLSLWRKPLTQAQIAASLAEYDAFYRVFGALLQNLQERYGRFILLDLHSYNHRRGGPEAPAEPQETNPDVNLGTGTMDRARWAPIVDCFMRELRAYNFHARQLDVRENVKFEGRQLPQWVHTHFPKTGCALAIEIKKFFMDEWSGELDRTQLTGLRTALGHVIPKLIHEIERYDRGR
jgi:N-formylglutamate amidohydrolase